MKIERITDTLPVKIEQFAEDHCLTMVVYSPKEPGSTGPEGMFEAHFKGCERASRGCLETASGWGWTGDDAINAYARNISFKCLVLADGKRVEIPRLDVDWTPERHTAQPHKSMSHNQQKP